MSPRRENVESRKSTGEGLILGVSKKKKDAGRDQKGGR